MNNAELILNGIIKEYEGRIEQTLADVQVYLFNAVGVGEHGNVTDIVKEKFKAVSELRGDIDSIRGFAQSLNQSSENAQEAPAAEE